FVRGLQLRHASAIVLRIHHHVLSFVGGLGFAGAGSGGGAESLNFRAAGWAGDEPYRKRRAVGLSLCLGAHSTPGHRRVAPVWIQWRCQPYFLQISFDDRGEFPPRWHDKRKIQRANPVVGNPGQRWLSHECRGFRLDERRVPGAAARVAAGLAGAFSKGTRLATERSGEIKGQISFTVDVATGVLASGTTTSSGISIVLRAELLGSLQLALGFFGIAQVAIGLPEQMVRDRIIWVHRQRVPQAPHG